MSFVGVDFSLTCREQRVEFEDSEGVQHTVGFYLPDKIKDSPEGLPAVIYIHSLGHCAAMMETGKSGKPGIKSLREECVVISPLLGGFKDGDAYFDSPLGSKAFTWLLELVSFVAGGVPGADGYPVVNPDRLCLTGFSLGGAATLLLGAQCHDVLSCVVPVASYHRAMKRRTLLDQLSRLPVFIVHSASNKETTCPIAKELPLWNGIRERGGDITIKEVTSKHGQTFDKAYEVDTDVIDWVLKQRRSCNDRTFLQLDDEFDYSPFCGAAAEEAAAIAHELELKAREEAEEKEFSERKRLKQSGAAGCKWCAKGECWDHGQIRKGQAAAAPAPQRDENEVEAAEEGGEQPVNPMMQMMQMMFGAQQMAMKQAMASCQWCQKGECWSHGNYGKMMAASAERAEPYNPSAQVAVGVVDVRPATSDDVDFYLELNPVEDRAKEKLKELPPQLQTLVIAQSLDDEVDKTASLISRIVQARLFRPSNGDWICQNCKDLQFSQNNSDECRTCGASKPT